MLPQFKFWQGYCELKITGKQIEQLLNLAVQNNLQIWNVRMIGSETAEMAVSIDSFFQLRPLLRRTGCRMHVLRRHGAPFFASKMWTRKFLLVGLIVFISMLATLSSLVWQVKVEGNVKITTARILEVAKQQGIYPLQWKFKLPDTSELSHAMQRQFPDASWVGVKLKGTQIIIQMVEAVKPKELPLLNPRNLIASVNATVTEIRTEKGKPMVKVHTYVRKGDVLISGIIGNEQYSQVVAAKGTVKGIVWYTSHIEAPTVLIHNTYTGEQSQKRYLVIGNRALQITGFRAKSYASSTKDVESKSLHFLKRSLPVGWIHITWRQSQQTKHYLTREEAMTNGLERTKEEILQRAGVDAQIITQKILHESADSGKVYVDAYFEVEQSIAQEQPIVQGE